MSTQVENKGELIYALSEALKYQRDPIDILCGSFHIHLRRVTQNGSWQHCVLMARERAIKLLIKRIRKQPKSLFKG